MGPYTAKAIVCGARAAAIKRQTVGRTKTHRLANDEFGHPVRSKPLKPITNAPKGTR
jgi:hypothetical protein